MKKSSANTKSTFNNFQNFEIKKETQNNIKGGIVIEDITEF